VKTHCTAGVVCLETFIGVIMPMVELWCVGVGKRMEDKGEMELDISFESIEGLKATGMVGLHIVKVGMVLCEGYGVPGGCIVM